MIKRYSVLGFVALISFFASADDVWSGYRQLDWIESNGQNYIDTGVKARSGLVVAGDLRLLSVDPGQAVFGASDNGANALGLTTRETLASAWNQFRIHTQDSIVNFTFTYNGSTGPQKRYTYKFDNGYFTYGSTHPSGNSATESSYEAASNIFIAWMGGLGENGGSATYAPAPMLIYSFVIQDKTSGEYLRKMYPARRNSDGKVGMLDTVSGNFYLHGGSSPFIAGAETTCITLGDFMKTGKSAEVTVSGYSGSSTLSKVPVLVRISESAISGFSYSDTLEGGADVFFALDQFGMQRLACDIDTWNESGTSLVWVKVPELKGTTTKFYMFWGSGSAADRPPSTEVWSAYVGVWHMNSYDPVAGVTDETGHGWNATNITGGTATEYTGKFGPALKLSTRMRVDNYDTFVTDSTVTNLMPDVITASCLFYKPDGNAGWDSVLDKYLSVGVRYGWLWQMPASLAKINFYYGNGCENDGKVSVSLTSLTRFNSAWAYGFSRSDGYYHEYHVYTIASKNGSKNSGGYGVRAVGKNNRPVLFGTSAKSTCMDEVRIIREYLSDDRIKADYDMVNSASFAVVSPARDAYEAAVEVCGIPLEYGSNAISYGFDYDCEESAIKQYSVPATVEISGSDHRAVCDGWMLYSMQSDGTMAVERTSENPIAGESATVCKVNCSGWKKIEWLWHEEYLLSLSSADSTMGTISEDFWCLTNTFKTVTPVPADGYAFYRWTGDTADMDEFSTSIPMDRPRVLAAEFKPAAEMVCEFSCPTNTASAIDFMDPQYWADGRIPQAMASQVTIAAPPAGVTNTINVSTPFSITSLDVGSGDGGGCIEMVFLTGPAAGSSVSGDMHLRANTCITHALGGYDNAKKNVKYSVNLSVGGNMTVDDGASIDATGKGHIVCNGPEGKDGSNSSGSSHGGEDYQYGTQGAYDSALEPCMYGSALYSKGTLTGGGVIRLAVGGNLVVNGGIRADGTSNESGYGGAAGGAIWITSGILSGTGSISADGGSTVGEDSGCSGCGGRIAIYQTDPAGTDFSAFTGAVTAYGGSCQDTASYNKQRQPSSAGTIYYQAYGESVTNATLVIDNREVLENVPNERKNKYYATTPLDSRFDTGKIGNLVVRNCGHPAIGDNTVEVYGDITVESEGRFQSYGGLLKLCGEGEQTITGTNLFYNVSCTVPGKTLKFGTGEHDNFRIASDSTLTLKGDANANLVLKPAVVDEEWKITLGETALFDVSHVTVDHSNASGGIGIEAHSSVDGGSNVNWSFPLDSEPGDPLTWNGSVSDVFAVPGNWTDKHGASRLPLETDVIIIPGGCPNYPTLIVDTLFNSVQIGEGGSLTLTDGMTLTVTNSFGLAGTLAATGTEKIVFTGSALDFTGGTVNAGRSIFTISGGGAQTLDFAGCAFSFLRFRKPGGSAAVLGSLSADTIDILATNSVSYAFAQGVTLAAGSIACRSRFPADLEGGALVLAGEEQDGTWYVNALSSQYFSGVKVRDCNALGLPARAGGASEDLGGNVNWTFNTAAAEWIGRTGSFDVAANWHPAGVPGSGTDVLVAGFDGTAAATASGAVTVRTLAVGGGRSASSLRVDGVLTVTGDVEVNTNGTLVLNSSASPNLFGRDFIVRAGGKATHTALPASVDTLEQAASSHRLYVEVDRDVNVQAGGSVSVNASGYAASKGPLGRGKTLTYDSDGDGIEETTWGNDIRYSCAGHGSARGNSDSALYKKGFCYGSMFEPVTHGSGGGEYAGGGVIRMRVAGNMNVEGNVSANGGGGGEDSTDSSYTGAGGSVWLDVAGTLSGRGNITARGGTAYDYAGGGGRIALYTGDNAFTGVVSSESRIESHSILPGAGTVLMKGKDSEFYDLKVDCDSYNHPKWGNSYRYFVQDYKTTSMATDLLTAEDADRKALLSRVRVAVGHTSVLNLTQDLKVYDLDMLVNTGCIVRLNYCTLRILSSTHKEGRGWIGSIERCTRNMGEIRWAAGFSLKVR